VRREQEGDASRVDIEVATSGRFVIQIESKLHAAEGVDQTAREWADLTKRARSLRVPARTFASHLSGGRINANNGGEAAYHGLEFTYCFG
jgi:hypothetical protein